MSLRWRSELLLDLRMRGCHAHLLGPGWSSLSQASASGGGSGAAALSAALSALRLADVDTLPTTARLRVADEYVLHMLIDMTGTRPELLRHAEAQFGQALGSSERHIMLLPLDGKRHWVASAVEASELALWTEALSHAGVRLTDLEPSLFDEWRELHGQITDNDAVLVLLREEGATLMRLIAGQPVDMLWERFEPGDVRTLERRVRAFARTPHGAQRRPRWADTNGAGAVPTGPGTQAIYLLPESKTLCRYVWDSEEPWSVAVPAGGGAANGRLPPEELPAPAAEPGPVPVPVTDAGAAGDVRAVS